MNPTNTASLLRTSIRANAVFSTVSGLTFLLACVPIADWLGGRAPLEVAAVGGQLLIFAAALVWLSSREEISSALVTAVIVADLLWVLATIGVVYADVFPRAGSSVAVLLADAVLLLAVLQSMGLYRMRVDQGATRQSPVMQSRAPKLAVAVLLGLPALQVLAERFVTLPIGPSRMLTVGLCAVALIPLCVVALEAAAGTRLSRAARWATVIIVPLFAVAHLLAFARLADGPFGPVPGGPFAAAEIATPVDLSESESLRYVELEVDLEQPRTLETVFLVHEGELYVAGNMPEKKRWPSAVREQRHVRVRFDGTNVYGLDAHYVESEEETRTLRDAMNAKYGFDLSMGGPIRFFALGSPAEQGLSSPVVDAR